MNKLFIACVILIISLPTLHGHVLNYDSVTVCDGMAKQIQCPNNEHIHVLTGFYGKWRNHDCRGESDILDNYPTCSIDRTKTTDIAKEICQGQNTCKLISDGSIFGEPCTKGTPYLYITFFCMAQGQKLNHRRTEKNEEVVTVPSHGFVVEETKHLGFKNRQEKVEENKKKTFLPLLNPSPNSNRKDPSESIVKKKGLIVPKNSTKLNSELEKLDSKNEKEIELKKINTNSISDNEIFPDKESPSNKTKNDSSINKEEPPASLVKHDDQLVKHDDQLINTTNQVNDSGMLPSNTSDNKTIVEGEEVTKSALPASNEDKKKKDKGIRSSTICNGQSKLIACSPEEGIKINYAFYGKKSGRDCRGPLPYKDESPSCSALDAKSNVKSSCDGKQTCLLFADDNIYGKSLCPNVNKYLYLTYTCSLLPKDIFSFKQVPLTPQEDLEEDAVSRSTEPSQQVNTTVKVCNGEKRTISCNRETMKINEAFFGKESGKDCRGNLGYRDDIPLCNNPRALESIQSLCENKKSCELAGESASFGEDICPGVNKYLLVSYSC